MIKYIWQLPQNLLGNLMLLFFKKKKRIEYKDVIIYKVKGLGWGISLGSIIIVDDLASDLTIKHEYGHSIQSLFFGPFYLLIIGIPSFTMNILTRLKILKFENYYKRWPENWADKLGEVNRY